MSILDTIATLINQFGSWFLRLFGDNERVRKVQARVVVMCGFMPEARSVAAMLAASNPTAVGVLGVAEAICQAVSFNATKLVSSGYGTVNGVPIEGDFIGKDK